MRVERFTNRYISANIPKVEGLIFNIKKSRPTVTTNSLVANIESSCTSGTFEHITAKQ